MVYKFDTIFRTSVTIITVVNKRREFHSHENLHTAHNLHLDNRYNPERHNHKYYKDNQEYEAHKLYTLMPCKVWPTLALGGCLRIHVLG